MTALTSHFSESGKRHGVLGGLFLPKTKFILWARITEQPTLGCHHYMRRSLVWAEAETVKTNRFLTSGYN